MNIFDKIENGDYNIKSIKSFNNHEAYTEYKKKVEDDFYQDALEHVYLKDHHKAKQAFALAWDEKHAYGLREVVEFLDDLSELIRS